MGKQKDLRESLNPAGEFIDAVLRDELLPFVENYAIQEISNAFTASDAMEAEPLLTISHNLTDQTVGRLSGSMAKCVLAFVNAFSRLVLLIHLVPDYSEAIEMMAQTACLQFLERIQGRLRALLTVRAGGACPLGQASLDRLLSLPIPHHLQWLVSLQPVPFSFKMKIYVQSWQRTSGDEELSAEIAEKETLLLEQLKNDRSFHFHELISDGKVIGHIALLQRSLEWLFPLIQDGSDEAASSSPNLTVHRAKIIFDSTASNLFSELPRQGKSAEPSRIQFTETFRESFQAFRTSIQYLIDTCLYVLQVEVRVHCFYYIDLAYREGNYLLEEAVNEPDAYISALASDLISLESILSEWLPPQAYRFVFGGLTRSIEGMLLAAFRYLKGLNGHGCQKLHMNVAAIDQVLSIIAPVGEGDLHLVSDYYSLAEAGPLALIDKATSLGCQFTLEEYQAIISVYSKSLGPDEEATRKEYQNQMIKLQYHLSEVSK